VGTELHPIHIKEHIEEIEKVQRRGTRFVFNNYKSRKPGCVTNMLNTLQWEPLAHRRAILFLNLGYVFCIHN
jgi:hypothetical protein